MEKKLDDRLTPDDVFECAESLLHTPETSPNELLSICQKLVHIGELTWWRCQCGPIRPDNGEIDIFCPQCGDFRHLPERLSRSPWPLYVQCLMRIMPDTWFDRLGNWLVSMELAQIQKKQEKLHAKETCYPCSEAEGCVLPKAIAAGGSRVLPKAIAARGATSPVTENHRTITCIDGMIIHETGQIQGLQWIALPMMPPESF